MPLSADRVVAPNLRLRLSNRPENVMLVRQVLTGIGEAVELPAMELNDISTAVTEACNNVVLHAYGGQQGPLEIDVHLLQDEIKVVVRDDGVGVPPESRPSQETAGLGIAVIKALAARAQFRADPAHGTEVEMTFRADPALVGEPGAKLPAPAENDLGATVELALAPASLIATVLPRLLSVLAARAHFKTDRIADVQLLADALAAAVPSSIAGSYLSIAVSVGPHDLELRIAPLRGGRSEQLMLDAALEGLAPVIGKLTDRHTVTSHDQASDAETLALRLLDHR